MKVSWLGWLPAREFALPRGGSGAGGSGAGASASATTPTERPTATPTGTPIEKTDAIIFAHGFLGSRFDQAHVCEALASDGFVVLAPEFAESLAGSFVPNDLTDRPAIVQAKKQ